MVLLGGIQVSTEPATLPSTGEALHELQKASDLFRESKVGKRQKEIQARKQELADYIALILVDAIYPVESFFPTLLALPSAISAAGAITAWPSMTVERRDAYLRWVDTLYPSGERV